MNITVIGGGNIGTVLLGELSADTQNRFSLLTSKPEAWHRKIEVLYSETGETLYGELAEITNDAAVTAKANLVFIAVPSNALPATVQRILPYVQGARSYAFCPAAAGRNLFAAR